MTYTLLHNETESSDEIVSGTSIHLRLKQSALYSKLSWYKLEIYFQTKWLGSCQEQLQLANRTPEQTGTIWLEMKVSLLGSMYLSTIFITKKIHHGKSLKVSQCFFRIINKNQKT